MSINQIQHCKGQNYEIHEMFYTIFNVSKLEI